MTVRCLILGGFEPSGHDSTVDALVEIGRTRGHAIDCLRWRDRIDLADHPMFTSHRYAAARGEADIAGLLDEPWIVEGLAADLGDLIDPGYEFYLSVHPWSSMICAQALAAASAQGLLLDYHCDFGPFPIVSHERINAYCGGGRIRALRPRFRARCHVVGAAAPQRFHDETPSGGRPDTLVISAGSDGWAVRAMLPATHTLIASLTPSRVVLLAPKDDARLSWVQASIPQAEIIANCHDISDLLKSARWYLCKGSGVAVAEGLAAGCQTFVSPSGIFWEDEVAEHLCARGVVADANLADGLPSFNNVNVAQTSNECRKAADRIWDLVECGAPPRHQPAEEAILAELIGRVAEQSSDPLPRTGAALKANLEIWLEEWRALVR